ncbi:MAG: hypothetical protein MK133_08080, partial [Planctomycetes bacterium]|nr:hypothetical protein [Planctomycetota bacterium]
MNRPADQGAARKRLPALPGSVCLVLCVLACFPGRWTSAADPYVPTEKELGKIRGKLEKLRERLDKLWK